MANDITIDAVRMALNLNQLKAEVTGWNLVNASSEGASFFTIDQTVTDQLLGAAAGGNPQSVAPALANPSSPTMAIVNEQYEGVRPTLDEMVTDSVVAGLNYQVLSESLNRHFGLMRLAVTGRS